MFTEKTTKIFANSSLILVLLSFIVIAPTLIYFLVYLVVNFIPDLTIFDFVLREKILNLTIFDFVLSEKIPMTDVFYIFPAAIFSLLAVIIGSVALIKGTSKYWQAYTAVRLGSFIIAIGVFIFFYTLSHLFS